MVTPDDLAVRPQDFKLCVVPRVTSHILIHRQYDTCHSLAACSGWCTQPAKCVPFDKATLLHRFTLAYLSFSRVQCFVMSALVHMIVYSHTEPRVL